MKKLQIAVEIQREVALKAGCTEYGHALFSPSSEFLSSLSDEERAVLSTLPEPDAKGEVHWNARLTLTAPTVTDDAVRAALANRVAKAAAAKIAETEAEAAKAARLAALVDRIEAAKAAERAKFDAAEEAKVSAECDARIWCAEHAATVFDAPELARAAREKRKILSALREAVLAKFSLALATLAKDGGWYIPEDLYDSSPREDVPSREAYAMFDALTAAKDRLARATGLPNAQITIGPIARHDVASHGTRWRTGVRIEVEHPWLSGGIVDAILTEPVGKDDEE